MFVKVILLTWNQMVAQFNDEELRKAVKENYIIDFYEHFFMKDNLPYLLMILKCSLLGKEPNAPQQLQKIEENSLKSKITEANAGLFKLLKEWRWTRSKKEGVPPYILLTNQQLLDIANKRPQSSAALGEISGVGAAKLAKYGEDILKIVADIKPETSTESQYAK